MYVVPKGQTINTENILDILEETVIPWPNAHYGEHQWALIQDNAPCHDSKKANAWITPKMQSSAKKSFAPIIS